MFEDMNFHNVGNAIPAYNSRKATIRISKMIMQETGSFNPMFSRPYTTYVDQHKIDCIAQRINESPTKNVSPAAFAGLTSDILVPDATPRGEIILPNGFNERRIRFIMEVNVISNMGSEFTYYFMGYSDYLGISHNDSVDPNMNFYINSFVRVSKLPMQTPNGTMIRDIINQVANVINGSIQYQFTNQEQYLMRPQDIFTGIQSSFLQQSYPSYVDYRDSRHILNNNSVCSKRSNCLPTNYISEIVSDYAVSKQTAGFGGNNDDIYTRAKDLVAESRINENIFIRALSDIKGYPESTVFTFNDLIRIDPNIQAVTQLFKLGLPAKQQLHQVGQTAYWHGTDRITQAATYLANAVPALMMELLFTQITFTSTNHDISGRNYSNILDYRSLTDADLSYNFNVFINRLERELLYDLTFGNQELYTLEMSVNLLDQTYITLSLGNEPPTTFAVPSFCDSLMLPTQCYNQNAFATVVHDFEQILNNIDGSFNTSMMPQAITSNNF